MSSVEFESSFTGLHNPHHRVHEIFSLFRLVSILYMIIDNPFQKPVENLTQFLQPTTRALKVEPSKIRKIISEVKSRGLFHRLFQHVFEPSLVQIPFNGAEFSHVAPVRAVPESSAATGDETTIVGTDPNRKCIMGPCFWASPCRSWCGFLPKRWKWPITGRPIGPGGSFPFFSR
ncbi:ATP synthase subunit alpha [Striga asiatica]|uniref:ATP synthase subunit alpha n=1 Tax=Striga asiatica TaxID=4170 RepID=A0A5A7QVP2_STRAF|nr:ATP synthase subunit alpha [Striga asiatica]